MSQNASAQNAAAQSVKDKPDKADMLVLLGGGIESKPLFPGATSNRYGFSPEFGIWREGDPFPIEAPDESNGFAIVGKRGSYSAGPAISFARGRKGINIAPGFSDVGFGIDIGAFAESYLAPELRLRAELRQAIGAHKALSGDVSADFVLRTKRDNIVATLGPRIRWASEKYHSAFFGVSPTAALASGLAPYQPASGIYAYGISTGAHIKVDKHWGFYAYAEFDRLTGDAAVSPIVANLGDRNQATAGLVLTRRFRIKR